MDRCASAVTGSSNGPVSTGTAESRLSQLQAALKCGTNCGSCLPDLRRLAQQACDRDAVSTATP